MSEIRNSDIFANLVSVYLIAAALSPSKDPKLPWPSSNFVFIEKSCAKRTSASYTA